MVCLGSYPKGPLSLCNFNARMKVCLLCYILSGRLCIECFLFARHRFAFLISFQDRADLKAGIFIIWSSMGRQISKDKVATDRMRRYNKYIKAVSRLFPSFSACASQGRQPQVKRSQCPRFSRWLSDTAAYLG